MPTPKTRAQVVSLIDNHNKVNQDERNIWVVSLEDSKDYIMVRVEDMDLEETQRMPKSK